MKFVKIAAVIVAGVVLPVAECQSYPTMEEARRLFPLYAPGQVGGRLEHSTVNRFCKDLLSGGSYHEELAMEAYLISAITTASVRVSQSAPSVVDQPEVRLSEFTAGRLLSSMNHFATNAVQCEAIAAYVGRWRFLTMPTGLPVRVSAISRPRSEAHSQDRIVVSSFNSGENGSAHEYQQQINSIWMCNQFIHTRRVELLNALSGAVRNCQDRMTPEEFTAFTNRLVNLSHATKGEMVNLFSGLDD